MFPGAEYRILHRGVFAAEDFILHRLSGKKRFSATTRRLINAAWQEARLNPHLDIYNGEVWCLERWECHAEPTIDRPKLHLYLRQSDYKSFYGTNIRHAALLPSDQLSNALAACVVVETTEGSIFVGRRNPRLAETSGVWHVPGGTFDQPINPLALISRELKEELNLDSEDFQALVCLGLGENLLYRKPELLCYAHLHLNERQLASKLKDAIDLHEHSEHVFVPVEELADFVRIHPFAPIGKAAVEVYLQYIQPYVT